MEQSIMTDLLWNRDEKGLRDIETVYGPALTRLALRITDNSGDAGECVNDTYLAAWNSIPPNRPQSLFAYLAKICRNLAFGVLDRRNAGKRSAVLVELTAEMEQCIPDLLAQEQMDSREIGRILNQFLGTLKPEQRRIFLRRYWYGDTVKETAAFCGVSEAKVKTSLHRSREKLRTVLQMEGITI
jgi:RNA polymerase sigma-70 factor (ECF subfamily)